MAINGSVVDIAGACHTLLGSQWPGSCDVTVIYQNWDACIPLLDRLAHAVASTGSAPGASWLVGPVDQVKLLAAVPAPRGLFCAGANYLDHVKEMGSEPPDKSRTKPFFFLKSPAHTIVGPGDTVRLPGKAQRLDWEAELGVVIGRPTKNVSAAQAVDHVAGYVILNDVSARDYALSTDWPNFKMDWFSHKNFDTANPVGAFMLPRRFVADPHRLGIRLWVNDELRQDSNTSQLIFNVWELIEHLSTRVTLLPGDLIATGTPAGTARAHAGAYLKAGDTMRVEIERLGSLVNPVEAEPTQDDAP